MRVLVACEYSGVVRDAFRALGHDAVSCDLLPTDVDGPHYQGDVFDVVGEGWDLMVAHPPCTYLTNTGNKWFKPEFDVDGSRARARVEAVEFVRRLYDAPVARVAIENPVGHLSTAWRKPDQYVHPYYFGDPHSKKTGLWLRGLPLLERTCFDVEPRFYVYKDGRRDPIWHVESMSMPPLERMKYRSRTFSGLAAAMASQWGGSDAAEGQA